MGRRDGMGKTYGCHLWLVEAVVKLSRMLVVEIFSCAECPLRECVDGFASHHFRCKDSGKETSEVDGPRSAETVAEEQKEMFKNCDRWEGSEQE